VTFTFTLGWWIVPTFISALFVVPTAFQVYRSAETPFDAAEGALTLSLSIIVALASWVAYFAVLVAIR